MDRDEMLGDGFGEFTITPERLELVQKLSRSKGAVPGTFFGRSSGKALTEIRAAILGIRFPRALFPPRGSGSNTPICRSADGIEPAIGVPDRQSETCATCPHASWDRWRTEHIAPDCHEKAEILLVDVDTSLPYLLEVPRTSVTVVRRLQQELAKEAMQHFGKTGEKASIFDFSVVLTPEESTSKKVGSYFVLVAREIRHISTPGKFQSLFVNLVKRPATVQAAALANKEVTDKLLGSETPDF